VELTDPPPGTVASELLPGLTGAWMEDWVKRPLVIHLETERGITGMRDILILNLD